MQWIVAPGWVTINAALMEDGDEPMGADQFIDKVVVPERPAATPRAEAAEPKALGTAKGLSERESSVPSTEAASAGVPVGGVAAGCEDDEDAASAQGAATDDDEGADAAGGVQEDAGCEDEEAEAAGAPAAEMAAGGELEDDGDDVFADAGLEDHAPASKMNMSMNDKGAMVQYLRSMGHALPASSSLKAIRAQVVKCQKLQRETEPAAFSPAGAGVTPCVGIQSATTDSQRHQPRASMRKALPDSERSPAGRHAHKKPSSGSSAETPAAAAPAAQPADGAGPGGRKRLRRAHGVAAAVPTPSPTPGPSRRSRRSAAAAAAAAAPQEDGAAAAVAPAGAERGAVAKRGGKRAKNDATDGAIEGPGRGKAAAKRPAGQSAASSSKAKRSRTEAADASVGGKKRAAHAAVASAREGPAPVQLSLSLSKNPALREAVYAAAHQLGGAKHKPCNDEALGPHVSHLVVAEDAPTRTIKILFAMAQGVPVVRAEWVLRSLEAVRRR